MGDYRVKIKEASKDLTAKERIAWKDLTDVVKLDARLDEPEVEAIIITPKDFAILEVHNEKATPADYENYIIIDENNVRYSTGSRSFWNSFTDIYEEMKDEDEEWSLKIYKKPSKNYSGKDFITCSII